MRGSGALVAIWLLASCSAKPAEPPPVERPDPPAHEEPPASPPPVAVSPFGHGNARGAIRCEDTGPPILTLQLYPEEVDCAGHDWEGAFLWIELPHGPDDPVPRELAVDPEATGELRPHACYTGGASSATGTRCIAIAGTIRLTAVSPGERVRGELALTLPDGTSASGPFDTGWCGGRYEVEYCASGEPTPRPTCAADADHCCLPDGTVVRPGGCQPIYPGGVQPATERGADGWCKKIPCHKRCLPPTARIATPGGEVALERLRVGDQVWTVDGAGRRVAAPIERVSSVAVGPDHAVVELTLADGRTVRASPGHPDATGQDVGRLQPGDRLDGAAITGRRLLSYRYERTFDLLPAGPTGQYWADGVLLGSTLKP